MGEVTIKDLYVGKPDAKDEIDFEGQHKFLKTFVVAEHFNIASLLYGSNCFVTGFKGTGKTALLFYLDNVLKTNDSAACSSFIFFKELFSEMKRDALQTLSRRILSSVTVQTEALLERDDFSLIWRWIFFKRIVADNDLFHRNLFVDNEDWIAFEKKISQIKDPVNKRKNLIPNKIKMALPYKEPNSMVEVTPEFEVDLSNIASDNYRYFISTIDEAETLFSKVTRTDIPYFIFVDELEAYYGEKRVFLRDLHLIRDLLISVKYFNGIFAKENMPNTKIVCSVRTEMINSISRFVVSKEVNKVISGFSIPLQWSYTNTNSYMHPIIQVLLKRIAMPDESLAINYKKIYDQWFPEKIHGIDPVKYILDNSWCKPRDMVRLLRSAQNSLHNDSSAFTQAVFDDIRRSYSEDSLEEIRVELQALYDLEETETIINCFVGYKTEFSLAQIRLRVTKYFAGSVLDTKFNQVVDDLYRLGFLGNCMPTSRTYRWKHQGAPRVILAAEWQLCIHPALYGALSLGSRTNYDIEQEDSPKPGNSIKATISRITPLYILSEFTYCDTKYLGRISISEFEKNRNKQIPQIGDSFNATIASYNKKYKCWNLRLLEETLETDTTIT